MATSTKETPYAATMPPIWTGRYLEVLGKPRADSLLLSLCVKGEQEATDQRSTEVKRAKDDDDDDEERVPRGMMEHRALGSYEGDGSVMGPPGDEMRNMTRERCDAK